MIFEVTSKEKVVQLRTIFTNLKSICNNMNFVIGKNGFYTQGLDACHICILELNLTPSWFDNIKLPSVKDTYRIGIDCGMLECVFKCLESGQTIKITYMENSSENLLVYFEGKGHDKMFEIPLLDIDTEQLEIPDAEYSSDIIINSDEFKHILLQLINFGDKVLFKLGFDDNIYMRTEGQMGKMQVRIKEENIVEYALEEEKTFEVLYGIKFINLFCNFSKLNQNIKVHISENIPMKLQYDLSNWKELKSDDDADNDDNYFKTYLAPLLDDVDD
jgi:proliferating cell nuclear antigen